MVQEDYLETAEFEIENAINSVASDIKQLARLINQHPEYAPLIASELEKMAKGVSINEH